MLAPPDIASTEAYRARRGGAAFWRPYVEEALARHGLADAGREPSAGFNATHPTFVCGDVVVKLFGHFRAWKAGHAAERAAQALIATDPQIAAPRVLAQGALFDDGEAPWPYLITTRVAGSTWSQTAHAAPQRLALAAEVGRQVRRVHALPTAGAPGPAHWPAPDAVEAARRSVLPPHLVDQVDGFLGRLGPLDPIFVHGDLVPNHIYVAGDRVVGLIDWGDALVHDRHLELGKLYFDTFGCDKALLRAFLDAANWPVEGDFPQKGLGLALHRQALGLAQHLGFDVFHSLPGRLPLDEVATLDELANALFNV